MKKYLLSLILVIATGSVQAKPTEIETYLSQIKTVKGLSALERMRMRMRMCRMRIDSANSYVDHVQVDLSGGGYPQKKGDVDLSVIFDAPPGNGISPSITKGLSATWTFRGGKVIPRSGWADQIVNRREQLMGVGVIC